MTLAPGARLGPYEVVSPIGAGGMGEVFRARDTRLGRDAAIKVLPAAFAQNAERLARFKREAQILAALTHANIAGIYGLEESNGTIALAMEYVAGEDLAARLTRGPVPVDEAIAVAKQIAEALEEAHEHGIVHRDLKPANVKLTPDGKVKVLDFGLAKAIEGDASGAAPEVSHSPTMTHQGTVAGVILGTAAYMSPEQARGKKVDKRADIWAFGVVLFEMLTGRRLFSGETTSDILAAVLTREPDWESLPKATPAYLRRLLARCLERDPKLRLRDIGEARLSLARGPGDAVNAAGAPGARGRTREFAAWCLAGVAMLGAVYGQRGSDAKPEPAVRLSFEPPPGVAFDATGTDYIVVSPNGRMLVFSGRTSDGKRPLWLRSLDSLEARPLPGTEDALEPFWSPDSRAIAFGAVGKLKRLDLSGGPPRTLADAPRLVGGAWSRDGVILFVPDYNRGLYRVSADGGATRLASSRTKPGSNGRRGRPRSSPTASASSTAWDPEKPSSASSRSTRTSGRRSWKTSAARCTRRRASCSTRRAGSSWRVGSTPRVSRFRATRFRSRRRSATATPSSSASAPPRTARFRRTESWCAGATSLPITSSCGSTERVRGWAASGRRYTWRCRWCHGSHGTAAGSPCRFASRAWSAAASG
jgi:predicted Ser/Thr protein kinase